MFCSYVVTGEVVGEIKSSDMACFRKIEGCSQLQALAHIPVDAFKSFAGLEGMRLLNLLKIVSNRIWQS